MDVGNVYNAGAILDRTSSAQASCFALPPASMQLCTSSLIAILGTATYRTSCT